MTLFFFVVVSVVWSIQAQAAATRDQLTQPVPRHVDHNFFTATTTTATSTNAANLADRTVRIDGAKKVIARVSRGGTAGANTGSTRFFLQGSYSGSTTVAADWFYIGKWFEYASTTYQFTPVSISTSQIVLSGTSTAIYGWDMGAQSFNYLRCIAVEFTDGEHTCNVTVEY